MNLATTRYTFNKQQRLKRTKEINLVFEKGKRVHYPPLSVWYLFLDDVNEVKAGVGAAKKNLKRANKRNLVKRRVKEAYRLNLPSFKEALQQHGKGIHLFWLYHSKDILSFQEIQEVLQRLTQQILKAAHEKN